MQLEEIYAYKNKVMEDLLTDESIVKLINEDFTLENAAGLMYTQVFPYEFVPETVQDGKTYICCDVDIHKVESKTFYTNIIYVWVFAHKSRLRLPEGGVRVDDLCSKICKKLNGSREYGLGQLDLSSVRRFAPMTDYQGKCLTFLAEDFNRQYNPNAKIPARRRGA